MRKSILLFFCWVLILPCCRADTGKVNVSVDERMEMLTILQYFSDYDMLTTSNLTYKKDVTRYFAPYKNHPAISLMKSIIKGDYMNGSAVIWYTYQFSFPEFKPVGKITDDENQIEDYKTHLDTLAAFRKQLHDFYVKSDFHKFFVAHKSFYDSIVHPVNDYINGIDIVSIMEKHYGQKKNSYNIILVPLQASCGFGVQVHTGTADNIYGIVGPTGDSEELPLFPPDIIFQNLVIHEFSHSFCNPIIHKYFNRLEADTCLVNPILHAQMVQGYGGDWETCLYEHLVRANEVVITKIVFDSTKANKVYDRYYNDTKWIYLKGLVPLLENEYVNNRNTYKTEYDLMPKVISYFDEEKKKVCK